MAGALVLGTSGVTRESSSLSSPTIMIQSDEAASSLTVNQVSLVRIQALEPNRGVVQQEERRVLVPDVARSSRAAPAK